MFFRSRLNKLCRTLAGNPTFFPLTFSVIVVRVTALLGRRGTWQVECGISHITGACDTAHFAYFLTIGFVASRQPSQ
jgi:hypothetical protein